MTSSAGYDAPTSAPTSADRRWGTLAVLAAVLVMTGTDFTKVTVAMPRIAADMELSVTAELWLVDSYALVAGAFLVVAAGAVERFGRKRTYLVGLAIYAVASLAGTVATSAETLLLARLGLGLGASVIIAGTVATIRVSFTVPRQRAVAYGVWTASYSVGTAIGPFVGGALVDTLGWPWVFAMNLPVAALALVVAGLRFVESRNPDPPPVDPVSVVTSVAALGSLIVLVKYGATGQLTVVIAVAIALVAAGTAAIFVRRQRRLPRPFLDLDLLGRRPLGLSATAIVVSNGTFAATLLLLTLRLQRLDDRTPLSAGIALVPVAVGSAVGGLLAPRVADRLGHRGTIALAQVVSALGLVLLALADGAPPAATALVGVGAGAVMTLAADSVMRSAPLERTGDAGAIQETAFALGAGVGVAVLGTVSAVVTSWAGELAGLAPDAALSVGVVAALGTAAGLLALTALSVVLRYVEPDDGYRDASCARAM